MKLNRWLEEANVRPGRFFVVNFWIYAIAHIALMATLAHAIVTRGKHTWIVFCALAALMPSFAWSTYRSVKRMLRGEPRDELWDEAVPSLIVIGACFALYQWISQFTP